MQRIANGPTYRRVDPRIWTDEKFRSLALEDMAIALYLLTSSSTGMSGIFVLDLTPLLVYQDGLDAKALLAKIRSVAEQMGWKFDVASCVVYLPNWRKYNPVVGINQTKGIGNHLHLLPDNPFFEEFLANTDGISEDLIPEWYAQIAKLGSKFAAMIPYQYRPPVTSPSDHVRTPSAPVRTPSDPLVTPLRAPCEPLVNQEQEQEHNKNTMSESESNGRPPDDPTFDQAPPDRDEQPKGKQHQDDELKPDDRRAFEEFWAVYPRKVRKARALNAWKRLLKKSKIDKAAIIRAVEAQRKAPPWNRHLEEKELEYIPHPATWLNAGGWEDELPGAPDADWAKRQMCDYLGYWDQDLIQPLLDAVRRRGEDARLLLRRTRDKTQILADLEAC